MDDVVIVGAGPAGLAAAATLRARGIDASIIERGRVGEPWRGRYDRLHLHTIRSLSHLPGYRIPRDFGRWVPRDQFVQYLEQYAAHYRFEPRFGVEATRIDRDNGRWSVSTTAGAIPARPVGFQPRAALMDALAEVAGSDRVAVVCALTGQRGVGKT